MARGRLRVYLGASPGVGKTYAMLSEALRRQERGTRVVVAGVVTRGLPRTEDLLAGVHHVVGAELEEILDLGPEVVCVDDLAHHQDLVDTILGHGIDVVSTVNIGDIASLADVVERVCGTRARWLVPDAVLQRADQVELVDITPEALRRRMAHGNLAVVDPAAFAPEALADLRELALRWVAQWAHGRYPSASGLDEVVVVAITGAPGNPHLVRRAARLAQRSDAALYGVHVRTARGTAGVPELAALRDLLLAVGGEYHEVVGEDPAVALIEFANEVHATQLVIGEAAGSVWQRLREGSVVNDVLGLAGKMDVHVVGQVDGTTRAIGRLHTATVVSTGAVAGLAWSSALSPRRRVAGYALALAGVPTATAVALALVPVEALDPFAAALFLAVVTFVAIVGGRGPALLAAAEGALATTYFFTQPRYTLALATTGDVVDVVLFVLVALAVGTIVSRLAEREDSARRSRGDAELLARVAGGVPSDRDAFVALLVDVRASFGLDSLAVLVEDDAGTWSPVAVVGEDPPRSPVDGLSMPLDAKAVLVARCDPLPPDRRRVLFAVAQQMAGSLERQRLVDEATQATVTAETERLRTAILRAVSHDFRTPLASIKAAASSLLEHDVDWPAHTRDAFVRTIVDKADHLDRMVADLLDLSRLEAGGLERHLQSVGIEDVLPHMLAGFDAPARERLDLHLAEELPRATADPALLERTLANIVNNALVHTPPDTPVRVETAVARGRLMIRVIDHGPGIPPSQREDVLLPFRRLDDRGPGAGLGLAVAKGFTDAMGGDLHLDDTPGGGLTVTLSIPEAAS